MSQTGEGLYKNKYVTDQQIGSVPCAFGLDGLTRFQMKLNQLKVVDAVYMPPVNDYRIHEDEMDFIWIYRVRRKEGVPWSVVDAAICKASLEFFAAFATA